MASRSSVVVAAVAAAVAWRVGQGVGGGDEARPAPAPRRRGGWRRSASPSRRAYGACARKNVAACERDLAAFRESGVTTATLRDVVTYRAEQWWATTASGIPLTLLAASVGFVLAGSLAYAAATGDDWEDALFASWLFVADPAAHAGVTGAAATAVGFVMTVVGLVIFGFVVSVTSEVMGARVEALKLGNSAVVEQDHTLVLGYSENLRPLIAQVALANESEGGGAVVVLTDRIPIADLTKAVDFSESDAARRAKNVATTATVARRGSPLRVGDLRRVSAPTAKCVVVLADHDVGADESDAKVMRAVLALSAFPKLRGHVVAEVRDVDNAENVRLVSRHPIECVVANDAIGRMMINCARQPLLASVLQELLGFEGDEFYLRHWPALVGKTFRELVEGDLLEGAVAVGLRRRDGAIELDAVDATIREGDEVIVIAGRRHLRLVGSSDPQHYLFLGWRNDIADMVAYLDEVAPPGSQLTIAAPLPIRDRDEQMVADGRGRRGPLRRLSLRHVVDTVVSRGFGAVAPRHLRRGVVAVLGVAGRGRRASPGPGDGEPSRAGFFGVARVRGRRLGGDGEPSTRSSAGRRRAAANDRTPSLPLPGAGRGGACAVVTELRDISLQRNVRSSGLADCDFVASHELVARIVAMVSERAEVSPILDTLLDAAGPSLLIVPATKYVAPGAIATFGDVAVAALDHGDVAIGTLLDGADLVLNPRDKTSAPRAWSPDDSVAVIAAQPA
ncbi:ATP binding protein [Aureococcus anophagefferens]|nr:ATP binding protein [Aureococcus anophagefferens]